MDCEVSLIKSFHTFAQEYLTVRVPKILLVSGSANDPDGRLYWDEGLLTVLYGCC